MLILGLIHLQCLPLPGEHLTLVLEPAHALQVGNA
jgi:hypothetical protein